MACLAIEEKYQKGQKYQKERRKLVVGLGICRQHRKPEEVAVYVECVEERRTNTGRVLQRE